MSPTIGIGAPNATSSCQPPFQYAGTTIFNDLVEWLSKSTVVESLTTRRWFNAETNPYAPAGLRYRPSEMACPSHAASLVRNRYSTLSPGFSTSFDTSLPTQTPFTKNPSDEPPSSMDAVAH